MKNIISLLLLVLIVKLSFAQNDKISMNIDFNPSLNELIIDQEIIYYNKSEQVLNEIYFHNWPNSFKDKYTPLSKRLLENYQKELFFAKPSHLGFTEIKSFTLNNESIDWVSEANTPDIFKIDLKKPLNPKDTVTIKISYKVQIPRAKYTRYGRNKKECNLRYWYIVPATFDGNNWKTMSNLNMDDLLMDLSDYNLTINIPNNYNINSELDIIKETTTSSSKTINLIGKNRLDLELNITTDISFEEINTSTVNVITNLKASKLNSHIKQDVIDREILFIQSFLGNYPHQNLFLNKIDYQKNPVYGFNQLPSFLAPYSDVFEWDIKMFKILSKKYLDKTLLVNSRKDAWVIDGIQHYLMLKYVEKYYPEVKAIGNVSKIWGIRNFNLSKIKFNEKYPFVFQFATRKNLDQALTTQSDSLSNFNRKIANKYKAGLGIRYLDEYLGDSIIPKTIKQFYIKNYLSHTSQEQFNDVLKSNATKDIDWFLNDYLKTKKKIDYTINSVTSKGDSLEIEIENKKNITTPILLYGVKDKNIKFKKWLTDIDSVTTVAVPKNGFDKVSLNYENLYPEFNLKNNWKNIHKKLFNRPIQFKFLKDIENPYYNQLFYTPTFRYNYYDGAILGIALANKTILKKNFIYKITPSYSTKSRSFSGNFSMLYQYYPEKSKVYRYWLGMSGSKFHYNENLSYVKLNPYAVIQFNRKSLRDVGGSSIVASFTHVDKEKEPILTNDIESYKYNILSLDYNYSKPEIINDFRYNFNFQLASNFSKLATDIRFRKLTDTNRQFDFRLYAGLFLQNKTKDDFFSFSLDKPTDYLFQYNYLGRSEDSGFFRQQIIIAEGGFKSLLPTNTANSWMTTFNSSIGIWRWVEVYNDAGFLKNKNTPVYFAYENGVRLNFVHNIFEIYFPFYSNNGWEVAQPNYSSKIRFVITARPKSIINFFKRGFL